jgi:hypothetical protein
LSPRSGQSLFPPELHRCVAHYLLKAAQSIILVDSLETWISVSVSRCYQIQRRIAMIANQKVSDSRGEKGGPKRGRKLLERAWDALLAEGFAEAVARQYVAVKKWDRHGSSGGSAPSDFPRNPSIDGQFHGHAEHRPEGAEQISLGQSDAARAASDAPGGESTNLQALKGRNKRPVSPVSPFQGWYVPGSAYPGRRSRVAPLHSAPGWHVPPRWGKEAPCAGSFRMNPISTAGKTE